MLDPLSPCGGEPLAAGCLELVWAVGYENGDPVLGDSTDVENAAHWRGPDGALTQALYEAGGETAGFIEAVPGDPGRYQIHDFWDHSPQYVRKRLAAEMRREATGESIEEARARAGRASAESRRLRRENARLVTEGATHVATHVAQLQHTSQHLLTPPAPAPAPAPAPDQKKQEQPPEPDGSVEKPAKKAAKPALPFRAERALGIIAAASHGRFIDSNPGPLAINIEKIIRTYPDLNDWAAVGKHIADGGEAYAETLDSRWVTMANFSAALGRAKAPKPPAKPANGNGERKTFTAQRQQEIADAESQRWDLLTREQQEAAMRDPPKGEP